MTDWDQLREVGQETSPPPFESLVATAARRDRRARIAVVAATTVVVAGVAIGVGVGRGDDGTIQPIGDPSHGESEQTDTTLLPEGVLALPEPEGPPGHPELETGRYWIPLTDSLAFEVDLPDGTAAHDDGLFLATEDFVLKTEVAGERYGVPRHPCTDHAIEPAGPTVDDLVQAINDLPIYQLSRPEAVELGGADGTYVEARVPRAYDASHCEGGEVQLPGKPRTAVSGPAPYVGRWWILDVDGQRVVVQQNCWGCQADQLDRATRTPRSITFTPAP